MLPQALKLKVIQQYEAGGKLQKDIAHDLGISTGSVSTILKASRGRRKHEDNSNSNLSNPQEQQPIASEELKPAINIGTPPSICNGSTSSNAGDGLKPEPDPRTSGGPLKFFLNKIVSPIPVAAIAPTEYNHSIPSNSVNLNLNPIKADEDIPNSNLHPPASVSALSIPPKSDLFIKDPETEMQINIESDTNVIISQNAAPEEEFKQSQSALPGELRTGMRMPGSEDSSVAIDWDSEENHQRRFWARVMDEKKIRQEEERELEEQRRYLIQERYNIEEQKKALEAKLFEVEELIPSAKQLKNIGIGFDQALVWIDCIKEKAEIERIDLRTATWKLAQDLRAYRDLGGLSKAIQDATQQLAMLNMVNDQQKRAINTLVHLQQIGMTEDEIGELVKLVGRWNGVGQGSMDGKLDDRLIGVENSH